MKQDYIDETTLDKIWNGSNAGMRWRKTCLKEVKPFLKQAALQFFGCFQPSGEQAFANILQIHVWLITLGQTSMFPSTGTHPLCFHLLSFTVLIFYLDFHYLSESSRSRNICQLSLSPTVPCRKRWSSNVICKVLPPYVKPLRSSRLVVPPSHSVGPCNSVNQPVEHPHGIHMEPNLYI